jgi:two-component system response regulator ResD
MPKRILVVDNELRSREIIACFLRESGYEVKEADDGAIAIEMLDKNDFALIICDLVMPQLGAFDVLRHMESRSLSTAVILITGHPDLLARKKLERLPYLAKPFNMYDLLRLVNKLTQ